MNRKIMSSTSSSNSSMLLVRNSLNYVTIETFERILCVVLFKTGIFQRIKN